MRCRDPGDEISDDDYFYPDSVGSIVQLNDRSCKVPKKEFEIGFMSSHIEQDRVSRRSASQHPASPLSSTQRKKAG